MLSTEPEGAVCGETFGTVSIVCVISTLMREELANQQWNFVWDISGGDCWDKRYLYALVRLSRSIGRSCRVCWQVSWKWMTTGKGLRPGKYRIVRLFNQSPRFGRTENRGFAKFGNHIENCTTTVASCPGACWLTLLLEASGRPASAWGDGTNKLFSTSPSNGNLTNFLILINSL